MSQTFAALSLESKRRLVVNVGAFTELSSSCLFFFLSFFCGSADLVKSQSGVRIIITCAHAHGAFMEQRDERGVMDGGEDGTGV